jgi:predicted transcriptional regulator
MFLPIDPEWAVAILRGRKKWEIRRRKPSLDVGDLVVLYATAPLRAVVGTFIAGEIVSGQPAEVWRLIRGETPGPRRDFLEYFADASIVHAIRVRAPQRVPPFEPRFRVGQGWRFLDPRANGEHRAIVDRVRR